MNNGHLAISTLKESDRYLDACVRTRDKFEHAHGYYVARIKLQEQPGHWSAFRLYNSSVGKIGAQHIPVIRELQWRGVLKTPPLLPRYMESPDAMERLERVRGGLSVAELCERKEK